MKRRRYAVTIPFLALMAGVVHVGCAMETGVATEEANVTDQGAT